MLANGLHGVLVGVVRNDVVYTPLAEITRRHGPSGYGLAGIGANFGNLKRLFSTAKLPFARRFLGAVRHPHDTIRTYAADTSLRMTGNKVPVPLHAYAIIRRLGRRMGIQIADRGIRVMLVDSHRLAVCGLQRVIDDEKPDLEVVATATTCSEAILVAEQAQPDVLVLDADLAGQNEAAVVPKLVNGRSTRVLLLGGGAADLTHELAILRGACGVVRKDESAATLIKAIRKVHEGELWLDRSTTGRLFVELSKQNNASRPSDFGLQSLTSREQDVVRSLVSQPEADNKTLASSLHIGEHTLRNHLSRIYDKLGVPNRVALYVLAERHGLTVRQGR